MLTPCSLHSLRIKPMVTCLLVPFVFGNLACGSAVAATLPVTNCNDAGSGSLREALASVHSGDSVDLTALTCATISLETGTLPIAVDDLTLRGPGANALTIAASHVNSYYGYRYAYGALTHTGHGTLRIEALRITDNYSRFSGCGYGYYYYCPASDTTGPDCIRSTGTVYLNRSTVTMCRGGGVYSVGFAARDSTISDSTQGVSTRDGDVSIINSTISGNSSSSSCVALRAGLPASTAKTNVLISNSTISGNYASYRGTNSAGCILGRATINNSTIAFNQSGAGSGGLFVAGPEITIESSILAHNSLSDLSITGATRFSGRNNVIIETSASMPPGTLRVDPLLLTLADNGGPTQTHALAAGSPAIDAGSNSSGLANDQRGAPFARVTGAGPDIGAFERQSQSSTNMSIGPGFTGSWFDPAQNGHGLMLEVLTDNRVLATWFTFNPEGSQQSWFGGVGTYRGATATIIDVARPTGGRWIPNFDPNSIVRSPWGTLTFTFTDCDHGRVDFSSGLGYGSGSMNLQRLTQPVGLTCP